MQKAEFDFIIKKREKSFSKRGLPSQESTVRHAGLHAEPPKGDADAHGAGRPWNEPPAAAGVCAPAEPAFDIQTAQGPATGPDMFYSVF